MTRTLTTPKPTGIAAKATIDNLSVQLYRGPDLRVDPANSGFSFVIHHRDENGGKIDSHTEFIPLRNWPAPLRARMQDLRAMIIAYAETEGILEPGTDTDDFKK